MNTLLLEKLENLNELFLYAINGVDSQLKNNELTTEDIDKLVGALLILHRQYSSIADEAKTED